MTCEGNVCGIGGWGGPLPGDPDNVSVMLSAVPVAGGIRVSWNYPTTNPHAVAHILPFRGVNENFDQAVQLSPVAGSFFEDKVLPGTTYFYWIRIVSINGTTGEHIGPASAAARSYSDDLLEALTGKIDAGVLAQALSTSISGITGIGLDILKEIEDRIAANMALSQTINGIRSDVNTAFTIVENEITKRTEGDVSLVNSVNTMAAVVNFNYSLFVNEKTLRTTKDSAYAQDFTILYAKAAQTAASVTLESKARSDADGALASRITSTEVSLNGNIATVQTGLSSQISVVNGKIVSIGALYTAKVQVNKLIGGFGIYNDGSIVDAGFDVDRFWVGRTGPDKVKPFIIDNGIVYIDKARIRNADIDTLKIAGNSVMVGAYATGGSTSVGSGGSTTLISRTIDLGDSFNSGLMVMATIYLHGGSDDAVGFRIYINGVLAGDQRTSMRSGYGSLFPASGFLVPGSRFATVSLQAYIPGAGSADIINSSFSIMGGKR